MSAIKESRQSERRFRFTKAFEIMPLWETWSKERSIGTADEKETRIVAHCKSIPRCVRRDMARKRAHREFRAERGLPLKDW